MLNRALAPSSKKIEGIHIPDFKKKELSNGVPLYYLKQGEQEVLKIEIILSSGVMYEDKPGISYFVSKLLNSGTPNKSASQIAEELDYYGAFLETSSGFDHVTISAYCLRKFLKPILSLLEEILLQPIFPENELKTLVRQKLNELSLGEKKDSQVAARRFRQNIFGLDHPYGRILSKEEVKEINTQDLKNYYSSSFFNRPLAICSGYVDEEAVGLIGGLLNNLPNNDQSPIKGVVNSLDNNQLIIRSQSVQSSIRVGKKIINRHHEDIHKLQMTTSILGGYFGSRLMRNIREDKGYTYGIGASIAHLIDQSFLMVSTDVVKENTKNSLVEINKEFELLRNNPVPIEELNTIKSYLTGQFLTGLDSPFSIAAKFKSVLLYNLDYSYYNTFLSTLEHITPKDVMEMAQKYFDTSSLFTVVVGENI